MNTTLLAALLAMSAVGALVWAFSGRTSKAAATNLFSGLDLPVPEGSSPLLGAAHRVGQRVRHAMPKPLVDGLETKIIQAGYPYGLDLTKVLGIKAAASLLALLFGLLSGNMLIGLIFAVLVFVTPDVLIGRLRDSRRAAMQRAAADMIDQLTICVEAGLGFDAALARVANANDGPLASELQHTLSDMRAGVPRAQALRMLAERTEVPEVQRFVSALVQAQKHGVSLADTLRIQAAEMRLKRKQRTEEIAAKMPVKMTFPTLLCIMPALFIVVLGPAAINIMHTLGDMAH
jgi:tight adherence protein C